MIRVLIVEDSKLMALQLEEALRTDAEIVVAGRARNGREAVEMNGRLKPDIVTMDIHMPEMDGLEATRQMMAHRPVPILIVSNSTFREGMGKVFEALSSGALDIYDKTQLENFLENGEAQKAFISKVKFLAGTPVIRHPLVRLQAANGERKKSGDSTKNGKIVVIGASTGGPQALVEVFKNISGGFPYPILVVQHIVPSFTQGFSDWLGTMTSLKVKVASAGERVQSGCVYVAAPEAHMAIDNEGRLELIYGKPVDGQLPSANVLLESAAAVYGNRALGIILTGMGSDGARGLKAIRDAGGDTIAQDEKTSVIYGMPKTAAEMGGAKSILPLNLIESYIKQWART